MSWDILLHWMTHVEEGSWGGFRSAVAKLVGTDANTSDLRRRLRIALSDLGHADFFVEGSQRWRILPPVLAGLACPPGAAVLAGGRTPRLAAGLADAVAARACRVVIGGDGDRPASIRFEGPQDALAAAAAEVGIPYVSGFAITLCAAIVPVPVQLERAAAEAALANWSVRSFDLDSLRWVEGLRSRSACEFQSRYGRRRFYLHSRGGRLLRLPKREAVYASAMLRDLKLAEYDSATVTLSTPAAAPLPEAYSRAACLCAGMPADFDGGRLLYNNVAPDVAAVLLVAAGQPFPGLRQPGSAGASVAEQGDGQPV